MPDQAQLERLFRELQRSGQLDAPLLVIREEWQASRNDLDGHYMKTPLTTREADAEVYMLQGRMKACADIITKFRTLAGIGQAPKPEA